MKTLLSAGLFLALLSPVSSQPEPLKGPGTCLFCNASRCISNILGATKCLASNTTRRICYSKIIDVQLGSEKESQTIFNQLGCMNHQDCHPVKFTASLPDSKYIYMEDKCCDKMLCNNIVRVPKQEDRTLNGMQCPGCLDLRAKEPCLNDTTVRCHGWENACISYAGSFITPGHLFPRLSLKGCATRTLCDLVTGAREERNDMLKSISTIEAKCSIAEFPLHY